MVDAELIKDFFKLLNKEKIKYVLIKNDEDLIPEQVKDGDDVDILVHPKDYDFFLEVMKKNKYIRLPGESKKYFFVYKMKADIYLKKKKAFFHAYEKLSCVSFTNMGLSKLPLDTWIQEKIWSTRIWDNEKKWWIMEDKIILLYLITRSIFDKKEFRKRYIKEIELREYILDTIEFKEMCHLVFFKFTNKLIELLKQKKYSEINITYQQFCNY